MFRYKIVKYIVIVFIHMVGGYHGPELIDFKRYKESSSDVLNIYQQAFALYDAKDDKKSIVAIEKRVMSLRDKVEKL
ncbi:hypothetical protein [Aeromonas jandaei]|uniref:hypothetical protein n=1 Tax=Aeromonas jandaei TaxID=650 RepID=UPI0038D082EB